LRASSICATFAPRWRPGSSTAQTARPAAVGQASASAHDCRQPRRMSRGVARRLVPCRYESLSGIANFPDFATKPRHSRTIAALSSVAACTQALGTAIRSHRESAQTNALLTPRARSARSAIATSRSSDRPEVLRASQAPRRRELCAPRSDLRWAAGRSFASALGRACGIVTVVLGRCSLWRRRDSE
jgi:hypothetical protein